ncbi:type II secretion system protein [Undibacterium flavidum]|uniref:Prepilin-type N-terminal cleavage/methylation domain-containing protein n=1 Tax=Undibacterium flavidum TaxID=2762297 RepID=A0ABR6YAY9_9BURK|nr:prepilin-type N-terminal cleavage/methylation domain-containing protein [Undibacterium flavidum]MBC3873726.1 prepilin-type N-terminal cleavage/methylation domain-containing protein [Undibacterium flavidum]
MPLRQSLSTHNSDYRHADKKCLFCTGFTLIELLVVLAIIALLATLSVPRYFQNIDTAKETVLADTLRVTRETIDKFYGDTGRYPESLEELVEKKYLRAPPFDPINENSTTWELIAPEGDNKGNVYNIKSTANGNDRHGKPYREY